MELTITFYTNFTLVVYFILGLFFIQINLHHLKDESNDNFNFPSLFLYLKLLLFANASWLFYKKSKTA